MKIALIGAGSRTGRHVLAQAPERGHEVVAFTRNAAALQAHASAAEKITVVEGDGRDIDAVKRAVAGACAVISIVAASGRKGPHQTAEVARVVIEAMRESGVRRLVFTSAYPIVAERPKLAIALLRRVFAGSYADAAQMERLVSASDLDWTIVRLNRLLDRPAAGTAHYRTGLLERPGALSRADAASVLLDVVADPALSETAVNVSG